MSPLTTRITRKILIPIIAFPLATLSQNMSEILPGLEFALSILRVLNIEGCTLPFIGIILGRPSSGKTVLLDLLRKWYCSSYTDNFTARSFVSHSTAVKSKEDLEEIDLLPKIKGKMFLTPEPHPAVFPEKLPYLCIC